MKSSGQLRTKGILINKIFEKFQRNIFFRKKLTFDNSWGKKFPALFLLRGS